MTTVDYIVLGKIPNSEPYPRDKTFREKYNSKILLAYLNQLRRIFSNLTDRFCLRQISNEEEYSVTIDFTDEQGFELATNVADELPFCWDEKARKELGKEYFKELRKIICPSQDKISTP